MKVKFIECTDCLGKIWVVCLEDKPSSFLVFKKDLFNYLKKADCK